jgi:glycosyltransferase involved in cell wall biosynthesis
MDKANRALACYLLEREIPIHVVGHSVDAELAKHPLATVHLAPRPGGIYSLGEPMLDLWGRSVARRVARRWPRAQVIVNGGNCIWPGINWAHYVHHAWRPQTNSAPPWYRIKSAATDMRARRRERAAFQKARLVITNSSYTRRHVVEYFQIDERRVQTIYLGSDPEWGPVNPEQRAACRRALQVSDSRLLAVFVGALALDHRKGFDVLFHAWRRLCANPNWDVTLLVAGTGSALPMWEAAVSQAGLAERVRLLGFSDRVKQILGAADLLISPVRYEAFGLNVQEAICRGVPAIVSAAAGVAELYSSELQPMLLPDPGDISDLVARLVAWRSNVERWKALFHPMGERLRSHTWHEMAEQFVSLVTLATEEAAQPHLFAAQTRSENAF